MIRAGQDSWGFGLASPTITIFDLEYTAWECSMARGWLTPGEYREVVQIGAVRLDLATFAVLDEFDCLVKPRFNTVSPYFQGLTGITAERVARDGLDLGVAYDRFLDFVGPGAIAAFGHDDTVLKDNLRLYGLSPARPLPAFHDLRAWFARNGLDPRGRLSCEIAPLLGLAFQGHAHNALDDARSLARAMAALAAPGPRLKPAA